MDKDHLLQIRVNKQFWVKFKEVARKNDEVPSALIRRLMEEYMRRHNPYNGQTHLDEILAGESRLGKRLKCKFCGQAATYIQYWRRNRNWTEQVPVCELHRRKAVSEALLSYGERKL